MSCAICIFVCPACKCSTTTLFKNSLVHISAKTDDGFLSTNAVFESCRQYARKPSSSPDSCSPGDFDTNATIPCQEYVWDTSQWTESLTTVNNLVCEQDSIRRLSGTAVIAGLFVGQLIFSDHVVALSQRSLPDKQFQSL